MQVGESIQIDRGRPCFICIGGFHPVKGAKFMEMAGTLAERTVLQ